MAESKKEALLVKKLVDRYAKDFPKGQEYIEGEVKKFLSQKSKTRLVASDIQRLERKVEIDVKKLRERVDKESKPDRVILPSERSREISQVETKKLEEDAPIPLDNYLVFAEAQEFKHRKEQQIRARKALEKKRQMKAELDEQVAETRRIRSQGSHAEEEYAAHVARITEEWKKDQEKQKRDAEAKYRKIKEERDQQLAELNERRNKDQRRKELEEQRIIAHAKAELEKEQRRQRDQMLAQKAYMDKVIQENELNKKIRAQKRLEEQAEEKKLQEEYARRLDDQERQRKETFQKMKDKATSNQKMFLAATAEKTRLEKEDEERARRFQEAKILEDERKAIERERKVQEDKRRMNEALEQQVREAKAQSQIDDEDKRKFAELYKAEAQRAIEEEKNAERRRRQEALKHKQLLLQQIEDKRSRKVDTDFTSMTEAEKQINMPNIKSLVQDEDVVKAVKIRLEKSKYAEEAKKRSQFGRRGGPRDLEDDDDYF